MEAKERTYGVAEASVRNLRDLCSSMDYSSYLNDEPMPDAASEKEQGNVYFKQKKFAEAIKCYSSSIGLSPTAVAFANRAMAYLKLRRFEEAENDCTEALNLDDRYIKAYSRRITARNGLGKVKEAMDDAEFAVSLDPNNPELRKQYSEIKALHMEKVAKRTSVPTKRTVSEFEKAGDKKDSTFHRSSTLQKDSFMEVDAPPKTFMEVGGSTVDGSKGSPEVSFKDNIMQHSPDARRKPSLEASVQDLASRSASQYMANTVKRINTPKTAYEFEVSWRALSDDSERQIQLLKSIAPANLPKIFKNALSAPFLVDIVKCTATIFQCVYLFYITCSSYWYAAPAVVINAYCTLRDDIASAVSVLENLAKVPRFDMIIMCLSPMHRSELRRLWNEVFLVNTASSDQIEVLRKLRPKYLQGEFQDMFVYS